MQKKILFSFLALSLAGIFVLPAQSFAQQSTINPIVPFNANPVNGPLSVTKNVINMTSGNLNWQNSVQASPNDILAFAVTLQAGSQDVHNVVVKDIFPSNLIYKGNLTVNATINSTDNPTSPAGINIGAIPAGQVAVISYQAQIAPGSAAGQPITNSATVTSQEGGTQTASATVSANNSTGPTGPIEQFPPVQGPTGVSTGLTNNPFTDSFIFPLLTIVIGTWFYSTRVRAKI